MYELQKSNSNFCSFMKISGAKWVKSVKISPKFLSGQVEAGKNIFGLGQVGLSQKEKSYTIDALHHIYVTENQLRMTGNPLSRSLEIRAYVEFGRASLNF